MPDDKPKIEDAKPTPPPMPPLPTPAPAPAPAPPPAIAMTKDELEAIVTKASGAAVKAAMEASGQSTGATIHEVPVLSPTQIAKAFEHFAHHHGSRLRDIKIKGWEIHGVNAKGQREGFSMHRLYDLSQVPPGTLNETSQPVKLEDWLKRTGANVKLSDVAKQSLGVGDPREPRESS